MRIDGRMALGLLALAMAMMPNAYASTSISIVAQVTVTANPVTSTSWLASNNPVNWNGYETLTANIAGGTSPFTYNYLVYNAGGSLVANMLYPSLPDITSNAYAFQQQTSWGYGNFMANVAINDAGSAAYNSLTYVVSSTSTTSSTTTSSTTTSTTSTISTTTSTSSSTSSISTTTSTSSTTTSIPQLYATPNPFSLTNKTMVVGLLTLDNMNLYVSGQMSVANTIISGGSAPYTGNWIVMPPASSNILPFNTLSAALPGSNALTLTINAISTTSLKLTYGGIDYYANTVGTNIIYGTWIIKANVIDANGDLGPSPALKNTLVIESPNTFLLQNYGNSATIWAIAIALFSHHIRIG